MKKKKRLAATTLGAVFALSTMGSAFAAEAPIQVNERSEYVVGQVSKPTNFDEISKEKVQAIFEQAEAGTLTKEEATKQLDEALGIKGDEDKVSGPASKPSNFDEISKEKVQAIFDQVEAGTLTKEEAMKQLDEVLGLNGDKKATSKPSNANEISKEKVQAIFDQVEAGTLTKEEAMKQLDEVLGLNGDKKATSKPSNANEISKEKVQAIFDQVEAGTLTKEEAMKQLDAALGLKDDKNKVSGPASKPVK